MYRGDLKPNNLAVRGSNHAGMREFNERIILQAVRQNGALPKADLARLTQLSTQTVAIIVGRLIDEGLLVKHERIRGKIGQPSVPIALNPDGALSMGIQVGRRGLEMLVCDFLGNTRSTWKYLYDYPDPQTILNKIVETAICFYCISTETRFVEESSFLVNPNLSYTISDS